MTLRTLFPASIMVLFAGISASVAQANKGELIYHSTLADAEALARPLAGQPAAAGPVGSAVFAEAGGPRGRSTSAVLRCRPAKPTDLLERSRTN